MKSAKMESGKFMRRREKPTADTTRPNSLTESPSCEAREGRIGIMMPIAVPIMRVETMR
jgi:hypothetical protein